MTGSENLNKAVDEHEIESGSHAQIHTLGRTRETRSEVGDIAYTHTRVVPVAADRLHDNRVIGPRSPASVVDAYKIMCIQVLQRLRENNWNALAVVSPGDNEGKTLTAINLAISLAQEVDQTVLLVDADLRKPSVHKYFGMVPEAGLSDHLVSGTPIEQILVNPGIERFVILPGGRPLMNSVEMLGSMKMEKLVRELKLRYPSRIILFDLPPVLSVADTLAFSPYVDAAMMVVRERKTGRHEMLRAAEMLNSVNLIGTVLNQSAEGLQPPQPEQRAWLKRFLPRRWG